MKAATALTVTAAIPPAIPLAILAQFLGWKENAQPSLTWQKMAAVQAPAAAVTMQVASTGVPEKKTLSAPTPAPILITAVTARVLALLPNLRAVVSSVLIVNWGRVSARFV